MGKTVVIGLIAGLVLGIIQSLIFATEEVTGVARAFTDIAITSAVLGAVVGLICGKYSDIKAALGFAAVAGLGVFFILGLRNGFNMAIQDAVQGAIVGLLLGVIVHFAGKKLGAKPS